MEEVCTTIMSNESHLFMHAWKSSDYSLLPILMTVVLGMHMPHMPGSHGQDMGLEVFLYQFSDLCILIWNLMLTYPS